MTEGVLYIATEEPFISEAEASAQSVKDVMPETEIALITEQGNEVDTFDRVISIDDPNHSFEDKPTYIGHTPFERTIFLDNDIKIESDISELFELLSEFDIAAAHNARNYGLEGYGKEPENDTPDSFPEYNTGVIVYTNDAVQKFQSQWKKEYDRDHDRCHEDPPDQPSFMRALYKSELRVATVPRNYNCVFRRPDYVEGEIKVFHGRLLNIDSMGANKSIDINYASSILNSHHGPRIFDRKGPILRLVKYEPGKIRYLIDVVRTHGIRSAVIQVYDYVSA